VTGPSLERREAVYVLNLGDTENRFNFDSVAALNALLDEVDAGEHPKALVTVGTDKFWSNGLDLDWLKATATPLVEIVRVVQELFARVIELDYPTVAAIQGHCYAAGGMLALSHDVRLMREDRGFLCFPEVDIRMSFTAGMNALLVSKLPQPTRHLAMVLGTRFTGPQAVAAGIVDGVASESDLLDQAVATAAALASKDPEAIRSIKRMLYADTIGALRTLD
jgi:enoyl-CoA hydratase/carnithine racemase